MDYEDAELIAIGQLAKQLHYELTGYTLQWFELPCAEALAGAVSAVKETNQAVNSLLKT